jgi:hypothetical protein
MWLVYSLQKTALINFHILNITPYYHAKCYVAHALKIAQLSVQTLHVDIIIGKRKLKLYKYGGAFRTKFHENLSVKQHKG